MSKWTKDAALAELATLVSEIDGLKRGGSFSAAHTRWLARTMTFLREVFGGASPYVLTFASYTWQHTGPFAIRSWDLQGALDDLNREGYRRQLESARGVLQAASDELERKSLDEVYVGKNTGTETSDILKVLQLAERKLRKAIHTKPEREREVQDAFENLLVGADVQYSRESEHIEYSSKTYCPDFTMPKLDLAVEIKLCNRPDREKEIVAEINDDILAYKLRFPNLLFVVYDFGFIRDVDRFGEQFETHDGVLVRVVKH